MLDFDPYLKAIGFIRDLWWVWLPFVLISGTVSAYSTYLKEKYFISLDWICLEIRIPQNIRKSPKATEQMFAGFHGVWLPIDWKDRWLKGKFNQDYLSLETIANGGSVNFYIRTPSRYLKLVESHIYAQYPDAEVVEVPDHTKSLPAYLPNEEYDLWATEIVFTKDDPYPIRTYPEFEESGGIGEEKRVDPLAALAEALGILRPGEQAWIQYLVRPTIDEGWIKAGKEIVDKIMGRLKPPEPDSLSKAVDFLDSFIPGNAQAQPKDRSEQKSIQHLSPGEKSIATAIDYKASKTGFDCGIRLIYLARRDVFNLGFLGAVIGAFKQFASPNLNGFRINTNAFTSDKGFFANILPGKGFFSQTLLHRRKVRLFRKFKKLEWVQKKLVMNTEELATIYHLPTISVRAPAVPRIEAKKGMPPVTLPIEVE